MEHRQARQRASSSWSQHRAEQQQRQQQQQWQWRYQQQQHQQQQQQQQQQWGGGASSSSSSFSAADPKGYYQTLNVSPGASPQEVQEAFRSKALQHHPDKCVRLRGRLAWTHVEFCKHTASRSLCTLRCTGRRCRFPAEQKAQATERFKAISEAYTVLRNPAKRAQYDSGGGRF